MKRGEIKNAAENLRCSTLSGFGCWRIFFLSLARFFCSLRLRCVFFLARFVDCYFIAFLSFPLSLVFHFPAWRFGSTSSYHSGARVTQRCSKLSSFFPMIHWLFAGFFFFSPTPPPSRPPIWITCFRSCARTGFSELGGSIAGQLPLRRE